MINVSKQSILLAEISITADCCYRQANHPDHREDEEPFENRYFNEEVGHSRASHGKSASRLDDFLSPKHPTVWLLPNLEPPFPGTVGPNCLFKVPMNFHLTTPNYILPASPTCAGKLEPYR